jgi:protein gp37
MAAISHIEWTEASWNPVTGCSKISSGCENCYALRMALRLQSMGQKNYIDGFSVRVHYSALEIPSSWKKPRMIFVNSMGDLFHSEVPLHFIQSVFKVMNESNKHIYQVLTKRSRCLLEISSSLSWSSNIWAGVSVENADYLYRIDHLRAVPAAVRFISFEPLLGSIGSVDLSGIDWVIAGGESGPGARPVSAEWIRRLRDVCVEQNVPFFFKQWGGFHKKRNGRELDGMIWSQMPQSASISV